MKSFVEASREGFVNMHGISSPISWMVRGKCSRATPVSVEPGQKLKGLTAMPMSVINSLDMDAEKNLYHQMRNDLKQMFYHHMRNDLKQMFLHPNHPLYCERFKRHFPGKYEIFSMYGVDIFMATDFRCFYRRGGEDIFNPFKLEEKTDEGRRR